MYRVQFQCNYTSLCNGDCITPEDIFQIILDLNTWGINHLLLDSQKSDPGWQVNLHCVFLSLHRVCFPVWHLQGLPTSEQRGRGVETSHWQDHEVRWISRRGHSWWHGPGCGRDGRSHQTSCLQSQILKGASSVLCPGTWGGGEDMGMGQHNTGTGWSVHLYHHVHFFPILVFRTLHDLQPHIPWHLLFNPKSWFAKGINKVGLWLGEGSIKENPYRKPL